MTQEQNDQEPHGSAKRLATLWPQVLMCLLALALLVWLVPHVASAYHLAVGGRQLLALWLTGSDYRAAEHELQEALDWLPDGARAHRLLGRLYRWLGNWPESAEAWTRYVALAPEDRLGYRELSAACEQLAASDLARVAGQPCGADEESRRATLVRLWQMGRLSAADFVTAGDRFRLGRDWQRAADSYYRALLLKPESSAVWYGLGEVHQAREDTDAALDAYTRVLDLSGDAQLAAAAHSRRGKILADARRWAEASAELSQALALAPGEGLYYLEHGWYAYKAGGSLGEARAELKKAATLLPHDAWPHIRLADLASVEGDHAEMLVRARQAVALQPGLFWGWLLQGQALRHLGRLDEAEEALCHAVELAPEKAVLHWELGHLMRQAARMEEAIAEYQQAVELAPDNVWYHLSLADAYRSNARISEAVEVYQRVLELRPGNTAAQEALQELGH